MTLFDAHVHLITGAMTRDAMAMFDSFYPASAQSVRERAKRLFPPEFLDHLSSATLRVQADAWIKAMDENGIETAAFFPISEQLEEMRDFISLAPTRFVGYAFLNDPLSPAAPATLRRAVREYGLRGLKLYPCLQLFSAADERAFPLYEEAQSLGIPVTFHFGITHAPASDYRYTNPMDLQLPLNLFGGLNVIVAHFGAGYFREVCLLGFHNANLHLDTSGTNNWRDFTPERYPLEYVFRRAVEIYGPERILFGTDTVLRPGVGYRGAIKDDQVRIVENLDISAEGKRAILKGNARRLFTD